MTNTALVVHLRIDPARREELLELARAHGERSKRLEPGCLRFDVLSDTEHDDRLILVEVYVDDAALDEHWGSAHMADYLEQSKAMILDRQRHRCTV